MKQLLMLIVGALLLATAVMAAAAEKPAFDPRVHNETNLPVGILYVDSGTVYLVESSRIVVGDAEYPFSNKMKVFTEDGLKLAKKHLKKGQKVDVFANEKHEAVYIVLK
jgi:opacity protein-like surface antigen